LRGLSCSRVAEPSPPVVISTAQPSLGDLMTSNTSGLSASCRSWHPCRAAGGGSEGPVAVDAESHFGVSPLLADQDFGCHQRQ
jgi:hypothetical protein